MMKIKASLWMQQNLGQILKTGCILLQDETENGGESGGKDNRVQGTFRKQQSTMAGV